MKKKLTFNQILKQAPPIKAIELSAFHHLTKRIFFAQEHDKEYTNRQYSDCFISGKGTLCCPYDYTSAAPVSPHYAICDLWFKFYTLGVPIYITINDCMFSVNSIGVTAIDGTFTRLLPEK